MSDVERLIHEVTSLIESDENRRRQDAQDRLNRKEPVNTFNDWNFTVGFPGMILAWRHWLEREMDIEAVGRETGPLTTDYAARLVEFQLLQKIEKFTTSLDDTPISPLINTNMGLCWLYRDGPLGEKHILDEETGAFIVEPSIANEDDLDKLEIPRFRFDRSLHEARTKVFREIVGDAFCIVDDALPARLGAPFGTAYNIRGGLDILLDFKVNPDFAHRLMDFIAEAILSYNVEANDALRDLGIPDCGRRGTGCGDQPVIYGDAIYNWEFARGGAWMGPIGSDEVSCDMFSPADYEEFVYPYECKAAAAYDRVYYHSCGNLTPLFEKIVNIPNIHRVHVSPWSDMKTAIEVGAGKVILEKHLDPLVKLHELSRDEMRAYVKEVTDLGTDYALDMVVHTRASGGRLYRELFLEETGQA